jgi:ankyrin repeat protein
MRDKYVAVCGEQGDYVTNGFGHLNSAAAEIVVEEIRDVELTKAPAEEDVEEQPSCQPPNLSALCLTATLSRAAVQGCTSRVAELLSKDGIDSKDGNESQALSAAIWAGSTALVNVLLSAGAPVNPRNFRFWPPLEEAASRTKLDVMKILLEAGAKVDAVDKHGVTYVAASGYFFPNVLKILLDAGANPNATDRDGQTALMRASNYGYEDSVVLLIEHGAVVNQKDNQGRTALMHAANGMYVDAIPHLLSHGADALARDVEGKTALDLARASKNEVAIELIGAAMRGKQ